jgi:serine/threonine-protein kinase
MAPDAPALAWWRRVFDAADRALALDGDDRAALLAEYAAQDPALSRELNALLARGEAASKLDTPAAVIAAPLIDRFADGRNAPDDATWFGPYRMLRELGRGGMGVVYLAERSDEQYQKRVALKILPKWSAGDDRKVQRFLEERQILAALDHPDIAGLLDGGITAEGVPWFAMEFVEGEPIDRYCDRQRLSIDDRLRLFARVCAAVQYAHRNLVVHRDLKPANILITDEGRVRLLDFGIAMLLGKTASLEVVNAGRRILTPLYASPEQIRGEPISTASDVYSLGVLLNLLLTGRYPYDLASGEQAEVVGAVVAPERLPPSRALLQIGAWPRAGCTLEQTAAERATTARALQRRLRGDLDAIVLMAVAPEPARRYATAEHLQADVARHLTGLPVSARPEGRLYHGLKFVGRHRAGVGTAAAVFILVLAFALVAAVQSTRIRSQAARIALERDHAEEVSNFIVNLFRTTVAGRPDRGVTSREILDSATARIDGTPSASPAQRARLLFEMAETYHRLNLHDRAQGLVETAVATQRGVEPVPVPDLTRSLNLLGSVLLAEGRPAPAEQAYRDALALQRRAEAPETELLARSMVGLSSVLRTQRRLAEAEAAARRALALDRARPGDTRVHVAESNRALGQILLDRGDASGAAAHFRRALSLQVAIHPEEHVQVADAVFNLAAALQSSGERVAADSLVRYGLGLYQRLVSNASFGGRTDVGGAAAAQPAGAAAVQRALGQEPGSGAGVDATGTSADGPLIVFSSDRDGPDPVGDLGNQEIYVMRVDGSGQRRLTFHDAVDNAPAWSADGRRIAFVSRRDGDSEIYVMNGDGTGLRRLTNLTPSGLGATQPAWSPDGRRIAFRSRWRMDIYVIDVDGSGLTNLTRHPAVDAAPAWSPDGRRLAFVSERDGEPAIYVMDADGGNVTRLIPNPASLQYLAWSPDGRRIAFNSDRDGDREIYIVGADGSGLKRLTSNRGEDGHPSWSPDGRQIVFHRQVLGHLQVHIMNADGSDARRLTELSAIIHNGFPSWGPAEPR